MQVLNKIVEFISDNEEFTIYRVVEGKINGSVMENITCNIEVAKSKYYLTDNIIYGYPIENVISGMYDRYLDCPDFELHPRNFEIKHFLNQYKKAIRRFEDLKVFL